MVRIYVLGLRGNILRGVKRNPDDHRDAFGVCLHLTKLIRNDMQNVLLMDNDYIFCIFTVLMLLA